MKERLVILLLIITAVWSVGVLAQPTGGDQEASLQESSSPDVSAGLDTYSAYVWRGLTLNEGWVLQPWLDASGITIGGVPFSLNLWANFDLDDYHGTVRKNRFSEVDATLSAELGLGFTAGFVQYSYFNGVSQDPVESSVDTGEVFLAWSTPWAVKPAFTLYYDVEEANAAFLQCSLSGSISLGRTWTLDLIGEVGVASDGFAEYYTGTQGGLFHYHAFTMLTYQPWDHFGLSMAAGYMNHFKEDVLPVQDVDFYSGVSLCFTF